MYTFSVHLFRLLFSLFSILNVASCSLCGSVDQTYSCDCVSERNNHTAFFENDGLHNVTTGNFLPALKSLHYCQGSFFCKPNFKILSPSETGYIKSYLICFNDNSCLSNGRSSIPPVQVHDLNDSCTTHDCMYVKDLQVFNITNECSETGRYSCMKVGLQGLKTPFCLKNDCKSFLAIEKLCSCHDQSQNCSCRSLCGNSQSITAENTYALFFSFGDMYVTKGAKVTYFHWVVISILSIGLSFLLLMFCKLCEQALYPANHRSRAQNTEALRRILASTLDHHPPAAFLPPKETFSQSDDRNQSSPPPTYEQVLKDKVIEFKKSIA